jgi:hypothetical protein
MTARKNSQSSKNLLITDTKKRSTTGDGPIVMEYNAGKKIFTVTVVAETPLARTSSCLVK